MCKSKNDKSCKKICGQEISNDSLKELECLNEMRQKPHWRSFVVPIVIPIVMLAVLAVLLFLPLKCSSQVICNCCCKDTSVYKPDETVRIDIDVDLYELLSEFFSDTTITDHKMVISQNQLEINAKKSDMWLLASYRLAAAIILLLAIVFLLKYLVPYWTRVSELNDKQNERILRIYEEKLEFERLPRKKEIEILERQARTDMDETVRESEHNRKMDVMDKEYRSHLADVALEMVKSTNQSEEKQSTTLINMIQNLKK